MSWQGSQAEAQPLSLTSLCAGATCSVLSHGSTRRLEQGLAVVTEFPMLTLHSC